MADQRWVEYYGSLEEGPSNNGCYAWNWQECFAESIYDPMPFVVAEPTVSTTMAPTHVATLFQEDEVDQLTTVWSEPTKVLHGAVTFQYTLDNVASTQPLLLVDLVYELDDEFESLENQYVGFGVAEQVMQGALVVCSPDKGTFTAEDVTTTVGRSGGNGTSSCKAYLGSGMGITEQESFMPTVLQTSLNETHYHVQFSVNLFSCWSNPAWPARVLFSRGLVSGNGDPMPHRNIPLHRQAMTGVFFLSVVGVNGTITLDPEGPPEPLQLEPLTSNMIQEVQGTSGSLDILDGRVTVQYGLYEYGASREEVVHVALKNIPFDPEDEGQEITYVGFGFAKDTMSGLVITCAPHAVWAVTTRCHQWRGSGTNLSPLVTNKSGWHLTSTNGNGTHMSYTLAGRVQDVVGEGELRLTSSTNLRAIAAIGRAAPDTGTPLMHASSRDRTPMILGQLSAAVNSKSGTTEGKSGEEGSSGSSALASATISISAAPRKLSSLAVAWTVFWMVGF